MFCQIIISFIVSLPSPRAQVEKKTHKIEYFLRLKSHCQSKPDGFWILVSRSANIHAKPSIFVRTSKIVFNMPTCLAYYNHKLKSNRHKTIHTMHNQKQKSKTNKIIFKFVFFILFIIDIEFLKQQIGRYIQGSLHVMAVISSLFIIFS